MPIIRDRESLVGSFLALLLVPMILYGLLLCVDNYAYLAGGGPQVTIHIEHSRDQWVFQPSKEKLPVIGVQVRNIQTNEGYYIDSSGERHAVDLFGNDLAPGMIVQTRLPLLAGAIVPIPHVWWQAVSALVLGLMVIGATVGWIAALLGLLD